MDNFCNTMKYCGERNRKLYKKCFVYQKNSLILTLLCRTFIKDGIKNFHIIHFLLILFFKNVKTSFRTCIFIVYLCSTKYDLNCCSLNMVHYLQSKNFITLSNNVLKSYFSSLILL